MISNDIVKKLEKIAKNQELILLVLFGSRANNTYKKNSDWDFAVIPSKNTSIDSLHTQFTKLFDNYDLVDLTNNQDPLLRKNIAENSVLIYEEKSGYYDNFVVNAVFDYIDYAPLYKIEEEILINKINQL